MYFSAIAVYKYTTIAYVMTAPNVCWCRTSVFYRDRTHTYCHTISTFRNYFIIFRFSFSFFYFIFILAFAWEPTASRLIVIDDVSVRTHVRSCQENDVMSAAAAKMVNCIFDSCEPAIDICGDTSIATFAILALCASINVVLSFEYETRRRKV